MKTNKIFVGVLISFWMLFSQVNAAYLCEGMDAGSTTDISGTVVVQENGTIFKKRKGNYLVEINGISDGVKMTSFISFNEANFKKLQRCGGKDGIEISVRVRCKKMGEPEAIQIVCD